MGSKEKQESGAGKVPSVWGYFFRFVLLALPAVNAAAALVWAFGSKEVEKQRFGRGALLFLGLIVLLSAAGGLLGWVSLQSLLARMG